MPRNLPAQRPRVRTLLYVLVLVAASLVLVACTSRVPSEPAAITGIVSDVIKTGDGATMLVTGTGQVDKASVSIDARTTLLRETGMGTSTLLLADVSGGSRVRVWFDGPVAESYPVQAHAGTVLLLAPTEP